MSAVSLLVGGTFIAFVLDNRKRIWPSVLAGGIAGLFDGLMALVFGGMLVHTILLTGVYTFLGYLLARWLNKIKFDPTKYRTSGTDSGWSGDGSSGGGFSGHSGGSSGGGGGGSRW